MVRVQGVGGGDGDPGGGWVRVVGFQGVVGSRGWVGVVGVQGVGRGWWGSRGWVGVVGLEV